MEEKLKVFLESRQIPKEVIRLFENEKIDMTAIPLMEDKELAEYIPCYGDRLALKNFCKTECTHKRESLLDRIRQKYGMKKSNMELERPRKKYRKEKERFVDFGWHHKSENGFVQVRTKKGGGTRSVKIKDSAEKPDILDKAKEIFFPEGISRFGHISKFKVDLWDFKCNPIKETISVEQMYEITGLNRLRFYLSTEEKSLSETIVRDPSGAENTGDAGDSGANSIASFEDAIHNYVGPQEEVAEEVTVDFQDDTTYNLEEFLTFPSESQLDPDLQPIILNVRRITLHRGQVFRELIDVFKDLPLTITLEVEMRLPNGKKESGFDLGGVYRDALSEFWDSFYNEVTLGTIYKIPFIRHDMKEEDWIAVAKILKKGYTDLRYFPIKIGPAFIEYCLFESCNGNLLDTFSKYVSPNDWRVLSQAMDNFDTVENEEVLEILETLECKWSPSKENVKRLVLDIAHKEIIQKPMFVIDCWKSVLKGMLNADELKTIYDRKKASSKNISRILKFSEDNPVCGYLKKFLRESSDEIVEKLLRFATGSDVIIDNDMKVDFNSSTGLQRTPIGHTCSSTLELSRKYENYVDFRCEMNEVLRSNIWVMDII